MTTPVAVPLHTLHVDTGRSWRGGQAQVLALLAGLQARGVPSTLVAPRASPLAARARAAGLEVLELPLRGEWDLVSVLRLRALLTRRSPQVVHAHTAHAVTLAGLAARLARTPLVVAARRVDFPVSRLGRLKLLHLADRVIAVSDAVIQALIGCGLRPDRLARVSSGITPPAPPDPAAIAGIRARLAPGATAVVGTAGALTGHKDHRTFVEAASRLAPSRPGLSFLIAGEGELEGELRRHIDSAGLAGVVRLLGFVRDLPALLASLDVFVLSSHLEGLGTVVLEAMAAGAAVVATRAGGIPEMVRDRETGLLVPARDPDALAAAIAEVLGDPRLRSRLRAGALARLASHFSADRMVGETLRLYREWLEEKTPSS